MKCDFLSASGANTYEQCPLRYYAKYELGKKSGSTPAIGAGLIAHKALELYYRPDLNMNPQECFEEASKKEFCPDRGQFEAAKEMFFDLIAEEPKESLNIITTELNFEFFLESGAKARGFIDRVDLAKNDTVRIVDYKTGAFVPSMEELETGHQTNIYAAWVYLEPKFEDIKDVIFNYKYIRTGQQKTIHITRQQAYSYLEYFDHLYHAIVNDNSPKPTINSFCWNCEHRSECPEYMNALGVICTLRSACGLGNENIDNVEQVQDLSAKEMVDVYGMVSTLASCLDKEKKQISSWMVSMLRNVSTGKIESDNSVAKLTSRKVTSINPEDGMRIIKKYNLIDKVLAGLSAGDIEKAIKGSAQARKEYEAVSIQRDSAAYPTISKKK